MHVRALTPADHEAAARLSMRAFTPTPGRAFDPAAPRVPDERRLVAEIDGRVVGHLGAWELGHHLGGRRLATAGISAVVVAPEARGRGVGTRLLRAGLEAARTRGEVLASLFPLTRAMYRRHGFELAGAHPQITLDAAALAALPAPAGDVEVVPGAVEDIPVMAALERELAQHEHGMLDRSGAFADRALTPGEHDTVLLAHRDGHLSGYVVYGHAPSTEDGWFYRLTVTELVGRDADTLRALWRAIGSSSTAAREVDAVLAPEDPLELWLPERAWRTRPTTWRWMTRLLDPAAAIAARGWPQGVDGEVALALHDPVWPAHDGAWMLQLDGRGSASLTRGGPGRVALDVGALASWFTGWASATALARYGRLSGASVTDLATLDAATTGPTPWVRTFF